MKKSNKNLRIAFIATSGLWYGGTEKCAQQQAIALRESGHDVDFYYTENTHYTNGKTHPGLDLSTKKHVESFGIKTIPVNCESIDYLDPKKPWNNTNLFSLLDSSLYDVIIGNHKGESMWPYSEIKNAKVVEVIHGTDFSRGTSTYADGYVLITPYQIDLWKSGGGIMQKTVVIPQMLKINHPKVENKRLDWGLPEDKFIFGMHQGARQGLFTPVVLEAYARIETNDNFFVILGGDPEYSNQANRLGIKNFKQLSPIADPDLVGEFLSCLNVFAHGRFDGEVSSSSIIEAMSRSLPIITHPSIYNNGHLEQLDQVGIISRTVDDYAQSLSLLEKREDVRMQLSNCSKEKYDKTYRYDLCRKKFLEYIENIASIIEVKTERKIADYSADHQKPKGSFQDNYSSPALLDEIKNYFKKEDIRLLDLGVAGGQFVRDAHDRGWFAVGLEGSDSAIVGEGSKNWSELQNRCLFLADISENFEIISKGKLIEFDFIHSEEVLEHINEDKLDTLFNNIRKHLSPDGIVFLGIAMFPDEEIIDGKLYTYHVSVHDKKWWKEKIEKNGFEIMQGGLDNDYHLGFIFNSKVRNHQGTLYVCAKKKLK